MSEFLYSLTLFPKDAKTTTCLHMLALKWHLVSLLESALADIFCETLNKVTQYCFRGLKPVLYRPYQYPYFGINIHYHTMHKKCLYLEFFWSVFSLIRTEHSFPMWENTEQKNFQYGHLIWSDIDNINIVA